MSKEKNRRALLIGGAALAGTFWGWPKLAGLVAGAPELEPVPGVPGFWRMSGGPVTGGLDPLTFVPREDAEARAALRDQVRGDIVTRLHRDAEPGRVPVASFSDYLCPYCRVLTAKLDARMARDRLSLTWHEWPILGPASEAAAKAAIAARYQGAYVAFHKAMMRGRFLADVPFLTALSEDLGIDGRRLIQDMEGAQVAEELRISDAVAGVFGFVGTPALVVGRTVIMGRVDDRVLDLAIADAQDAVAHAV